MGGSTNTRNANAYSPRPFPTAPTVSVPILPISYVVEAEPILLVSPPLGEEQSGLLALLPSVPKKNVLVMGFYDRNNTGDELYKDAFRFILGDAATLVFCCTDDIVAVPHDIDVVIVGGGDVINDYFMPKVRKILDASPWFQGEVYAVSVGIPYESCADRWLATFDHAFLRNSADYEVARKVMGGHNVTQMCDACAYIPLTPPPARDTIAPRRIGIAVSRPFFLVNPSAIVEFARAIARLNHDLVDGSFELHLIAFNHHEENSGECDHVSCDDLYDAFLIRGFSNVFFHDAVDDRLPMSSIQLVRSMDVVVCMRYHSAVFALTNPEIATIIVGCSSKLAKLASDYGVEMVDVTKIQGLSSRLYHAIRAALVSVGNAERQRCIDLSSETTDLIKELVFGSSEGRRNRADLLTLPDPLGVLLKSEGDEDGHMEFERRLKKLGMIVPNGGKIDDAKNDKEAVRIARIVSLVLVDTVSSSCVWGLSRNLLQPDFDLETAARYVWGDRMTNVKKSLASYDASTASSPTYLPGGGWGPATKRRFVDLRCHSIVAGSYHRSGWAYVETGLQNLSARRFGRHPDEPITLDTYADETFLWACDANVKTGILPYKKPWVAFVHHTFDRACYPHDLSSMFAEPAFLASLPSCACLLTLTHTLADQMRMALDTLPGGIGRSVRVATLTHPTETEGIPAFSIDAFTNGKPRRLLQVGAWLRDEASFRSFDLGDNPLGLVKTILRTHAVDKKAMGSGFCSGSGFASGFCSGSGFASGFCSGFVSGSCVVTPEGKKTGDCNCGCDQEVEEIGYLGAEEYDALLSSSVVFLCLYDASAVNTVIECIVRKTPIIVNRLPAVEEALGADYPGFYEKGGSSIEIDDDLVQKCHAHLCSLDTSRYQLDTFLVGLDAVLATL